MATRPNNWKQLAQPPPLGTLTFSGQSELQKLPVPELGTTLKKLKLSLRALAWDDAEYRVSEAKVDDFARGIAPELQRRLNQWHDEPGRDHWLEEWWDEAAYFGYRDPIMINVSYYYGFDPHPSRYPQTAAHRAAALTRAALLFRRQLKRGLVEPDATKEGPLCMDTWRWMFDCCRVPAPVSDWGITYSKEGDLGDSGHVVVFRQGKVWKIDVAPHGQLLSTQDLERQFQHVYDNTRGSHPGVGALTSAHRDTWAKAYELLTENRDNVAILREIHSAAFAVSLDSERPEDVIDFSKALWHGGVHGDMLGNRWFDKPANFVVFDNVQAGVVGEHSIMDGTPMARMCDEMVEGLHQPSFDHGTPATSALPEPQSFNWQITPALSLAIEDAIGAGKALLGTQAMGYHLTNYGKALIKEFGVSPDSWTQMLVQLAYRRLFGACRPGGTYEAATTRRFFKGRTETIRVVTLELEKWLQAMEDPTVTDEIRQKLFVEATKVHIQDAKNAGKAQGIDRHLLGLKMVLREGEALPALFSDPLFIRSGRWTLSTSSIWSKHMPSYGWGEVVPDGFGVAYMTGHEDRLQFTVTSRKEMPNTRFVAEIARAANDLRALFDPKKSRL